ncbi:hypothetical protein ACW7BJ_27595 [Azospirillum argentinense]
MPSIKPAYIWAAMTIVAISLAVYYLLFIRTLNVYAFINSIWAPSVNCDNIHDVVQNINLDQQLNKNMAWVVECKLHIWSYFSGSAERGFRVLSIASIILTTFLAASSTLLNGLEKMRSIIAWIAAVVTGLLGFLQLGESHGKFNTAWIILDTRYNEWKLGLNDVKDKELWEAVLVGESVIHKDGNISKIIGVTKENAKVKDNNVDEGKSVAENAKN